MERSREFSPEAKKSISPELREYLESFQKELKILLDWLLKNRETYKRIVDLQMENARAFQAEKNKLWQSYAEEALPALREVRSKVIHPRGHELAAANRKMDESFNYEHREKEQYLRKSNLSPARKEKAIKSLQREKPVDEFAKFVEIPVIPGRLEKSLSTFRLGENFREEEDNNSFRISTWIILVNNAIGEIEKYLNNPT